MKSASIPPGDPGPGSGSSAPGRRRFAGLSAVLPLALLALAGPGPAGPGPAEAHPHIWVESVIKPQFKDGKIEALVIDWTFDDLYSFLVIEDFDQDKNGGLDRDELESLAKASQEALTLANYFLHITRDGEALTELDVPWLEADLVEGRITYSFKVVLDSPVDLARTAFSVGNYDATYYVDFLLEAEDPVRFEGDWPSLCRFAVGQDYANRIYFEMIAPTVITFECPTA